MKVNKSSVSHWMLLLGVFLQGLLGLARRKLRRGTPRQTVVCYSHKITLNLLALDDELQGNHALGLRRVFLPMDATDHRELQATGVSSEWAPTTAGSRLLADAAAVVTSHELHALG